MYPLGIYPFTPSDCILIQNNHKLEQLCDSLDTASTTVQACHILNELTMQSTNPTGSSEKSTVMNKVYVVTMSQVSSITLPPKRSMPPALWTLRHFGLESPAQELLAADDVHDPRGLLSSTPLHQWKLSICHVLSLPQGCTVSHLPVVCSSRSVPGLCACLVLLRPFMSRSVMSKKQGSLLLMGHLLNHLVSSFVKIPGVV